MCEKVAQRCNICQTLKNHPGKTYKTDGSLHTMALNEHLCVDILGPISLEKFERGVGSCYILVIMDRHSRYCTLILLKDITGKTIAENIKEKWILKRGPPKTLLSDQGRQFISKDYLEMLDQYSIKPLWTTAYNPTGNSIVERCNQEIGKGLRILKGKKLAEAVERIEFALNNSHHCGIGEIPERIQRNDCQKLSNEVNKRISERRPRAPKPTCDLTPGDQVFVRNPRVGN